MTNELVERFIKKYSHNDDFPNWLRKADPADMRALWSALLDTQQDTSISIEKRIEWAVWIIAHRYKNRQLLSNLVWQFAEQVYVSMPTAAQTGMYSIWLCINKVETINIENIEDKLCKVAQKTKSDKAAIAACTAWAVSLVKKTNWMDAAAKAVTAVANMTADVSAVDGDTQPAREKQVKIIKEVVSNLW
jgi:hypothetical protein